MAVFRLNSNTTPANFVKYVMLRQTFKNEKEGITKEISLRMKDIGAIEEEINWLEKRVGEIRPRIDGCNENLICDRCDIYSMGFIDNGQQGNVSRYNCMICGYETYR